MDAGVDGVEHFAPRGEMLAVWSERQLQELAEEGIPIGATLALIDAAGEGWPVAARDQLRERFSELHDAGTDAPMNGLEFGSALHRELELLVEFGLSPQEALRAATSTAAEALQAGDIGVIEPGRSADLATVWREGRPVVGPGE